MWRAALPILVALAGCVPASTMHGARLRRKAAADLRCPEGELFVEATDQRTGLVTGCGRRATYSLDQHGTWVLESAGGPPP